MKDYVIIVILIVAVLFGIKYAVSHFKGKGGCCGSGECKPRKKKLKKVISQKVFKVEGMSCEHCSNRVTEVINDIPHVLGKVDLKKGVATVFYEEEVPDELIISRIEKAGYKAEKAE